MMGLACYAVQDFAATNEYWNKALNLLKKSKKTTALRAELLNNLGCIQYETGNETNAIKLFEDSINLQRKLVVSEVYDNGKSASQHMLMKLAITQANIAYVHLRLKNADAAISAFERCQKVRMIFFVFIFILKVRCQ